jgi:hypothetical protein
MSAVRKDTLCAMGYPGDQDRRPHRGRPGATPPGGQLRPPVPGGVRAGYPAAADPDPGASLGESAAGAGGAVAGRAGAGGAVAARAGAGSRPPSARALPARAGALRRRGPLRGFPPLPGQPNPFYPPGQFSPWNRPSTRAAWLGIARPAGGAADAEDEPGYSLLAVSDPSADTTSTQTWAVIDDDHPAGGWLGAPSAADRAAAPVSERASQQGSDWPSPPEAVRPSQPGSDWAAPPGTGTGQRPRFPDTGSMPFRNGRLTGGGAGPSPPYGGALGDAPTAGTGANAALDTRSELAVSRRGPGQRASRVAGALPSAERGRKGAARPSPAGRRTARSSKRNNAMMAGLLLVPVLIVALVVAGYVYFNIKRSSSVVRAAPSNTALAPSSPAAPLGKWKYIQSRATDPAPLSLPEIFPRRFAAASLSGARTADRAGTKCSREVIGSALRAAVGKAGCTQVLRASYLSWGRKMMATIGVLNLVNVRAAERAGRAAGAREFIRQLPAAHGPTHNLTKGTGLEEAEVKGHYLILIWSEFTDLRAPSGARQRARLEAFSNALIRGTVNRSLTSRMVTGHPQAA